VVDRSIARHPHFSVPGRGDDCPAGDVEDAFSDAADQQRAGEIVPGQVEPAAVEGVSGLAARGVADGQPFGDLQRVGVMEKLATAPPVPPMPNWCSPSPTMSVSRLTERDEEG